MKYSDKNILHVVNIYFVIPFFIGGQFKYFSKKGFKMHVACSESEYLDDYAKEQGFEYLVTPVNRSFSYKEDIKSIKNIIRFIKEKKIGIIVGHTPKGALLAMIAGWLARVPKRIYFRHGLVYETSHGIKRFVLMTVDRIASLCATKIVCVSPSVLEGSIKDKLAPARKQIILGKGTCSGIDTQGKFNPQNINIKKLEDMKQKWGIKKDDWVIGYSGRLVKDKGIIELIEAFKNLQHIKNLKLLLVGMFEKRDSLPINIQQEIKNSPNIIWTDFQNQDMEYFYAMMDVYVLASYREGFPTGVLEAQSMEIPVITTKVTGCQDSIVDGETGYLVNNDPHDIELAVNKVYNGSIDGKKGRAWVVDNFDNLLVWKEIEKLYY